MKSFFVRLIEKIRLLLSFVFVSGEALSVPQVLLPRRR